MNVRRQLAKQVSGRYASIEKKTKKKHTAQNRMMMLHTDAQRPTSIPEDNRDLSAYIYYT